MGSVVTPCNKVNMTSLKAKDHADPAGIGGDRIHLPNTLIILVPAAVVVGSLAVKYGNCLTLLKSGVGDAPEISGANTLVDLVAAEKRAEMAGTGPTPVLYPNFVTKHAGLARK